MGIVIKSFHQLFRILNLSFVLYKSIIQVYMNLQRTVKNYSLDVNVTFPLIVDTIQLKMNNSIL